MNKYDYDHIESRNGNKRNCECNNLFHFANDVKSLSLLWMNEKLRGSSLVSEIVALRMRMSEAAFGGFALDESPRHNYARDFLPIFEREMGDVRDRVRYKLIKDFVQTIQPFKNLERMKWNVVQLEKQPADKDVARLNFSKMKELSLLQCDAYCFDTLSTCVNLTKFCMSQPIFGNVRNSGIDNFENFLMMQNKLQDLTIEDVSHQQLFEDEKKIDRIKFKLSRLVLKNTFFKRKSIAEAFFCQQDALKFISLQLQNEKTKRLDEILFYNNILKTGIGNIVNF
jgi:hypothetical protein